MKKITSLQVYFESFLSPFAQIADICKKTEIKHKKNTRNANHRIPQSKIFTPTKAITQKYKSYAKRKGQERFSSNILYDSSSEIMKKILLTNVNAKILFFHFKNHNR